jgi:hypothetical protein
LYAALDGNNFGSQPSCNHLVNFVVYFSNIRATVTWFRVLMIVFFSGAIPLFVLLLGFLILAPRSWTEKCTNKLQNVFDRNPRLGLVRYVIGIP